MTIEELFFQLLQVAVGNRNTLDRMPSTEEWMALFDMAKKQALVAIAFTGVTRLNKASDFGASLGMDEMTYLKWLGLTAKVAQRNKELNAECAKVCAELAHDGLQCCVLKGQSNLVNYPEDLRECRTAGDIDLWMLPHEGEPPSCSPCVGGEPCSNGSNSSSGSNGKSPFAGRFRGSRIAGVVEYAQQWRRIRGQKPITKDRVLYYHVEMDTDSDIEVELHYRPSFLCSPLRNMRLQRWFTENEQFGVCDFAPEFTQRCQARLCKFPIPTVSFNAVYQLLHIYKHLFEEGIGLRQLLDYYFVLCALHTERPLQLPCLGEGLDHYDKMLEWARSTGKAAASNEEIMHTLGRFGMKKFAGAVMYVLQTVLDPPKSSLLREDFEDWQTRWPWMICIPNEKEGKFLLNEIMMAGNFGKYDTRISHETPSTFVPLAKVPLFRGKKVPGQLWHAIEKTKHNFRLLTHYPEEVLCEPFFRLYHYLWRRFSLWRY